MSFELLEVPEGFKTNLALVIAPYVDPKFMKKIVQELMPTRLCLVVDEGVRRDDLEKIRNVCLRHDTRLEIRLGRARALVHMKAFYFEYCVKILRRTAGGDFSSGRQMRPMLVFRERETQN